MSLTRPAAVTPSVVQGVAAVLVTGAVTLAVLAQPTPDALLALGVAGFAASLLAPVRLVRDGEVFAFTLDETVLLVLLALDAGPRVPAAALLGVVIGSAIQRLDPVKAAFNAGLVALAGGAAVQVHAALAGDAGLGVAWTLGLVAATTTAWAITLLGVSFVLALVQRRSLPAVVREGAPISAISLGGNVGLGLLLAVLALRAPFATVLVAPLAFTAYFGLRGAARTRELHQASERVGALSRMLLELPPDVPTTKLVDALLDALTATFAAEHVVVRLANGKRYARPATSPWSVPFEVLDADGPVASRVGERGPRWLAAPIRDESTQHGVIVLVGRRGLGEWDEADVARLATMADDVAGALRTRELLSQVRAERDRLAEVSERLGSVVAAVPEGVVVVDRWGLVREWNAAMAELSGVPSDRALRKPLRDVLALEDVEGVEDDAMAADVEALLSVALDAPDERWDDEAEGHALLAATHGPSRRVHVRARASAGDAAGGVVLVRAGDERG